MNYAKIRNVEINRDKNKKSKGKAKGKAKAKPVPLLRRCGEEVKIHCRALKNALLLYFGKFRPTRWSLRNRPFEDYETEDFIEREAELDRLNLKKRKWKNVLKFTSG